MAIDPTLAPNRARLSKSISHWHDEFKRYRDARRETIQLYSGSPEMASAYTGEVVDRPWGNLVQLAGMSHVVTLAYGDPLFAVVPNVPEADPIVARLEEFLNKWQQLISLGDVGRSVALDSFFGWGIIRTGIDRLPAAARNLSGQEIGPIAERIDQDYFGFDGHASSWDKVSYTYDLVDVPLDEARAYEPFLAFNPDATLALEEYGLPAHQLSSRIHDHEGRDRTAQPMTRLIRVYFPGTNVIAYWPANDIQFSQVNDMPLNVRHYEGYHTGPYDVLSHLDVPSNLLPIAKVESTKRLHNLFNQLAEITSNQALEAKHINMYDIGSERDMTRLEDAANRSNVGVSNVDRIRPFTVPGPDQSQTAFMGAAMGLFKELSGNLDDTLGLNPTAGTATQSNLIRARTTVLAADMKRRMDRVMESVARKLAHLALNSTTLRLPMRRELPNSTIVKDVSWLPRLPDEFEELMIDPDVYQSRTTNADDFGITIVQGSMQFRSSEDRLQQIGAALGRIAQVAQLVAAGMPFDIQEYVKIEAKYGNLPELNKIALPFLPEVQARKDDAEQIRSQREGVGQYVRQNVSERSNGGALNQFLSQQAQPSGLGEGE